VIYILDDEPISLGDLDDEPISLGDLDFRFRF
jgi:hypothetical protein